MRLVRLLVVGVAGATLLASAEAQDDARAERLLEALTRGVPAADLLPRTAEMEAQAARASGLLDGAEDEGCRDRCGEAGPVLETLCTGLIRPEAARSKATCASQRATSSTARA